MEKPADNQGADPEEILNSNGLIQAVFELSDSAVVILERRPAHADGHVPLLIRETNQTFRQLFPALLEGSDFLEITQSYGASGQILQYLFQLQSGEFFKHDIELTNTAEINLRLLASWLSENKLIVILEESLDSREQSDKQKIIHQFIEQIAHTGSWEYDKETDSMLWSEGMYEIFGLDPQTPVSVNKYLDYASPEGESMVEQFVSRIQREDPDFEEDLPLRVNGENKVIKTRFTTLRDEMGKARKVIGVDVDITRNFLSEKELKEQHHFNEQVCKASPVLIAIFDLDAQAYTYLSKDVYPFVGYSSEQLLQAKGESLHALVDPEDRQAAIDFHNNFEGAADDDIREIEYRVKAADGTYRWLSLRGKVFKRRGDGSVSEMICSIQDHTQARRAEEKLKENELMQLLLLKKDEFISVASHELKTPIASLKASLQILKRLIEPAEKEVISVFLQKSIVQINKLATLTNDLLDITRMQGGKISLSKDSFDLDLFLADAIEETREGFHVLVQNQVTKPVTADRNRLDQVFRNFLSNAVKYSPSANKIIVRAEENVGSIKISVTDFGIGIPQDKLPYVFDRYFRVDDNSKQYSGLGLGLYISAEIIKMHGGEYGVESELGKGSTFWFSVPQNDAGDTES